MLTKYARAERMLTWNTAPLLVNDVIAVTWLADSTRFWYRVTRATGSEFVVVDPVANTQRPLFDHQRLAGALTRMEAGKNRTRREAAVSDVHIPERREHTPVQDGKRWLTAISRDTTALPHHSSPVRRPKSCRLIRSGWRTLRTTTCG